MELHKAVSQLNYHGVYNLILEPNWKKPEILRVQMKKSGRVVMHLLITEGEVPDDSVTYLVAEAEMLNEAKGG